MRHPLLLSSPKLLVNEFEYAFPTTTDFISQFSSGQTAAFFVLYPESETQTKTFALIYGKGNNKFEDILLSLAKPSILAAFALIVEQDVKMLESLYHQDKPQVQLPREEVMVDAETLYLNWSK